MVELDERQELLEIIRDVYRDVYGVRPRGLYLNETVEELRSTLTSLSAESERVQAEELAQEAAAIARFEARITDLIESGAANRATALRWIFDADGLSEDIEFIGVDYVEYQLGLPYRYFEKDGYYSHMRKVYLREQAETVLEMVTN